MCFELCKLRSPREHPADFFNTPPSDHPLLEYNLLSELGQTGPWRIAKGGSEVGRLI